MLGSTLGLFCLGGNIFPTETEVDEGLFSPTPPPLPPPPSHPPTLPDTSRNTACLLPEIQLGEIGVLGTHTTAFTKVTASFRSCLGFSLAHLMGCSNFVVSWQTFQDEDRKSEQGTRSLSP